MNKIKYIILIFLCSVSLTFAEEIPIKIVVTSSQNVYNLGEDIIVNLQFIPKHKNLEIMYKKRELYIGLYHKFYVINRNRMMLRCLSNPPRRIIDSKWSKMPKDGLIFKNINISSIYSDSVICNDPHDFSLSGDYKIFYCVKLSIMNIKNKSLKINNITSNIINITLKDITRNRLDKSCELLIQNKIKQKQIETAIKIIKYSTLSLTNKNIYQLEKGYKLLPLHLKIDLVHALSRIFSAKKFYLLSKIFINEKNKVIKNEIIEALSIYNPASSLSFALKECHIKKNILGMYILGKIGGKESIKCLEKIAQSNLNNKIKEIANENIKKIKANEVMGGAH